MFQATINKRTRNGSAPSRCTSSDRPADWKIGLKLVQNKRLCLFGLILVALFIVLTCSRTSKLTFALPTADWWTASPFITTQSQSLFNSPGLQIATLDVPSGLASKNAVVAGTADIGLSAATPLAMAAAQRENLVILGTYLKSSAVVGFVMPKDSQLNSIPPAPIAIVPSTISETYLYEYLAKLGKQDLLVTKAIQVLHQRPADIPSSLQNGEAKSAVIWEPFLSLSAERTGYTVNTAAVAFEVNLYLITRREVYERRRTDIVAFLKAVEESCRFLRENSESARHDIERHYNFRPNFLETPWAAVDYRVTFEREQMKAELIREARTAKALGSIPDVPNVDYLFPTSPPL